MALEVVDTLLVIPARGGSKGVRDKNLAIVGGIPLITRAVRIAMSSSSSILVVVSTDSPEIAALAALEGARVLKRPDGLAGDAATSESALQHVLDVLAAEMPQLPEKLIMMQCTSPFTTSRDLLATIAALDEHDCTFTACLDHSFRWKRSVEGRATGIDHDEKVQRERRQDRESRWRETGAVYGMRTEGFLTNGTRFFGDIGIVETSAERGLEIDLIGDLEVAQVLAAWLDPQSLDSDLFAGIHAFALDFDGVLTDNRVFVNANGEGGVLCSRSDGMGIELLRQQGVEVVIVTKERGPFAAARGNKLGVSVMSGVDNKVQALRSWAADQELEMKMIAYVGNDLNDLAVMEEVGLACCPADAHPRVRQNARLILSAMGGQGAVRELAERYLECGVGKSTQ